MRNFSITGVISKPSSNRFKHVILSVTVFIFAMVIILCACSGSQEENKDGQANKKTTDPNSIENLQGIDSTYYASVKTWVAENLFKDKIQDEAYEYVIKNHMHYLYAAYVALYPDDPRSTELKNKLTRFGVLRAPKDSSLIVPFVDLIEKYNMGDVQTVYYWGSGFGGIQIGNNGQRIWQGPICLGNLQLFKGKFSAALTNEGENALELFPGTIIIYPYEPPPAETENE